MGARAGAARLLNERGSWAIVRLAIERGSQAGGRVARSDTMFPLRESKTKDGERPKAGKATLEEGLASVGI